MNGNSWVLGRLRKVNWRNLVKDLSNEKMKEEMIESTWGTNEEDGETDREKQD